MERAQTLCTNEMYESLVRTRLQNSWRAAHLYVSSGEQEAKSSSQSLQRSTLDSNVIGMHVPCGNKVTDHAIPTVCSEVRVRGPINVHSNSPTFQTPLLSATVSSVSLLKKICCSNEKLKKVTHRYVYSFYCYIPNYSLTLIFQYINTHWILKPEFHRCVSTVYSKVQCCEKCVLYVHFCKIPDERRELAGR